MKSELEKKDVISGMTITGSIESMEISDTSLIEEPAYYRDLYNCEMFVDSKKVLHIFDPIIEPEWEERYLSEKDDTWKKVYPTSVIEVINFKDANNKLYGVDIMPMNYEDNKWMEGIEEGWIQISNEEADAIRNPPLTPEQIKQRAVMEAEAEKSARMREANEKIAIYQDAVDLEMAEGDEERLLKEWKKYRVYLNRINPEDAPDIEFPVRPE